MVVRTLGPLRLHPCSCEVAAFLSESINRVIITGRYLRRGSDLRKQRDLWTYTRVPLLDGEEFGERTKEMHPGVTYLAGSSLIVGCKGISELYRDDRAS